MFKWDVTDGEGEKYERILRLGFLLLLLLGVLQDKLIIILKLIKV